MGAPKIIAVDCSCLLTQREKMQTMYSKYLPPSEIMSLQRFRRFEDEARSALGRILLRKTLLGYATSSVLSPQAFAIDALPGKKPTLSNKSSCPTISDFNIAHDGSWVVAGVTESGIIGVDVAQVMLHGGESESDLVSVFASELTDNEQRYLKHASPNMLLDFYTMWAVKEAYVKATGEGILGGMTRIDISMEQGCIMAIDVDGKPCPLVLTTKVVGDGQYVVAVACDTVCNIEIVPVSNIL